MEDQLSGVDQESYIMTTNPSSQPALGGVPISCKLHTASSRSIVPRLPLLFTYTRAVYNPTMLNVEVTSHETIKPSSSIPGHLRSLPLSVADQLAPDIYIQAILFFHADGTSSSAQAAVLKESLSKTLAPFYPLAGRLAGDVVRADVHIDCNDEGAEFYEATVDGNFDAILRRPPMGELNKLMPNEGANIENGDPLLAVQLNVFACGGVALGVCIAHQVADAASMALFLNSWAEAARRGELIAPPPLFHAALVFPPADLPQALVSPKATGLLPRRFVIRAPQIDSLRDRDAYIRTQPPTRVEAVTALLWRCIFRARRNTMADSSTHERTPLALINVNLRKKMPEELTDLSFGSLITWAFVFDRSFNTVSEKERQGFLERSIRDEVTSVNGEYVRGQVEGFLSGWNPMEEATVDTIEFSSWCRMPFYMIDFGWGEPAWFCSVMKDVVNLAVLADTKDGRGMEVWVWLRAEEMATFERDPEMLEYVDAESSS